MKKLMISGLLVFFGCGPKEQEPMKAPTEIGDTSILAKPDTSENSLDYIGRYEGPVQGNKMALELSEDFTFALSVTDANGKTVETDNGTFKWNAKGDGIELSEGNKVRKRFFVGENYLVLLDNASDARLNPGNSGEFVLQKQSETQAAKSDGTPMDALPQKITSIHWKLSEINGRLFKKEAAKDYYIEFKDDGTFGAFAGCNKMGGKFELNGSKARLFNIMSTMMACPDMKIEDEFKKALESADNFVANEKVLQLRKGGANLLKFEAYAIPKP